MVQGHGIGARVAAYLSALLAMTGCGVGTGTGKPASPTQSAVTVPPASQPASASPAAVENLPPSPPPTFVYSAAAVPSSFAAHPITILVIGDSLGEDLGYGLKDLLGGQKAMRLVLKSVGSTGLANMAYYNWPKALARELRHYHPNLVVALLGGNDAVGFIQHGQAVLFGSPRWQRDYGARVATLMQEAVEAGAHLIWVGLPIMSPSSVLPNASMKRLNAVYRAEARAHPGVTYLSTWGLFQSSAGGYTPTLSTRHGQLEVVRDPDGVHIAPPAGDELIASWVLRRLDQIVSPPLCPNPGAIWHRYLPNGCPRL